MHQFSYVDTNSVEGAITAAAKNSGAVFFAGGTTLIDLMKLDVMTPSELVSVNDLRAGGNRSAGRRHSDRGQCPEQHAGS